MENERYYKKRRQSTLLGLSIVLAWVFIPMAGIIFGGSAAITALCVLIYFTGFLALAYSSGGWGAVGFLLAFTFVLFVIATI